MSAVRYVLARAAEQGFFEAVVPASQRFDPLLRGSIRRGARRAFAAASSETKVTDEPHVLRLAYLRVAGRLTSPPDDVAGVQQAFAVAIPMDPKRRSLAFWPASVVTLCLLVLAGAVVGFIFFFPTPRQRFAKSSLGEAMGEGLTDWTVGVSRRDISRQDKGHELLMAKGVKRQIGDGAFDLLSTALEQSKRVAGASSAEEATHATESLTSTLRSLDAALQTKKVPGFFDAYVDDGVSLYGASANVWMLGYYVEDRATLTIGGQTVQVLRGRRLDNLNLEVGGKAYESKVLDGWVLSVEEVEQWTIFNVVPALGKNHGFAFGAKTTPEEGSEGKLASKAGERIRADLLTRADLSQDDATELADLFSQRHSAFIRLAVLGDELYEPRGLAAKPRLTKALKRRQDEMDAKEITRIEDRLSRFDKSFERIAAVQASLDEMRIAVDATCRKTDCKLTADDDFPIGAKTLIGAKAAAIASRLVMVARSDATYLAFAESEMGPGGYATVYAIERELGLAPSWMAPYGPKDEAEHAQLSTAAFDKPADVLKKAAEAAYAKLYGTPMPQVTRTPTPK